MSGESQSPFARVSERDVRRPSRELLPNERVLLLADIADMLGCCEAEAIRFIIKNDVPYFTLPSGRMRFLSSSVVETLRSISQKRPARLNAANRQARARKAWEAWVVNKGINVVENADPDLTQWLEKLIEQEISPSDLMSLDVRSANGLIQDARWSSILKCVKDQKDGNYQQDSGTTCLRNGLPERKKFE